VTSSKSGGAKQRFWGATSGASQSMRHLPTPPSPTSAARARSPPRLQPSTVATSATQAAVDNFAWERELDDDEQLLWRGVVWKRKGLLWRERVFLLTSRPRFAYFDAHVSPPEYKGEIAWTYSAPVHCRRRSQHHFDVVTDDRDYHLASFDVGADSWIRRIDAALNMQATRKLLQKSSNDGDGAAAGAPPWGEDDDDVDLDALVDGTRTPSRTPLTKDQVSRDTLLLDEQPAVEGWLWKMGKQPAFAGLKKRYAILRGIQLFYYRDQPGGRISAPIGVIRCRAARKMNTHKDRFAFDIDAVGGRTFHCFVDSDAERDKWLDAIAQVLDACDTASGNICDDDLAVPDV